MVITNDELNELCKQQQDLVRSISSKPSKEKEAELLNINEQIKQKQGELLEEFWEEYKIKEAAISELERNRPKDFKREINRHYRDLIELYRNVMDLAGRISKYKKTIRDTIL